ncbi:MAG: response regulator [Ruminiclostridium sp.]
MEKIKVMLVDDEELSMELLARCIDWEAIGMEIVSKQTKAEQAVKEVDRLKPSIVVSDINMPIMDGLKFGKIVLEKNPKIKFILLTGYEEFEYAKHSVKIGVSDFLLKPICPDEISQSMNKMKKLIEGENSKEEDYNRLKKQLDENFCYLREIYLNKILTKNLSSEEIENSKFYGIDFSENCFRLCLIELSDAGFDNEEYRLIGSMAALEAVCSFFQDKNAAIYVFRDNAGNIAILCCKVDIDFEDKLELLVDFLTKDLNFSVTIGMGGKCENVKDIPSLYKKAGETLNYKIVIGNNQVIYPEDIVHRTINTSILTSIQKEKICFYVKAGLPEEAINIVFDFFDSVSSKYVNILSLKVNAIELISLIFNSVWEIATSKFSEMLPNCFNPVFKIDNIPDMKEYFRVCILSISNMLEAEKDKEKIKQVRYIIDFLKSNYSDYTITLKNTAERFYKNASYLSRLFKQETGESFIEYLTRIRMEESVKLLSQSDLKIYEVSEAVGILDANYFGKCFHKYTGMSVSEYKKSIRE